MSTKRMKFRVRDKEHCRAIQEALFKEGYVWIRSGKGVQYTDASHLFADDGLITFVNDGDEEYFKRANHEEYFLFGGKLVSKDYFKQPITPAQTNAQLLKKLEESPPIPREEHERQRLIVLLEASAALLKDKREVPQEWIDEVEDLWDGQRRRVEYNQGDF